jgi:hypothetical protein
MATIYASGQAPVNAAVVRAVEEVRHKFAGHEVTTASDGSGGVYVVIADLPLSERFVPNSTWLGFQISYLYPAADVYPHYVRFDLTLRDGAQLGPGYSPTVWGYDGAPAIQVSRRSSRWDPRVDTAALKVVKVLAWMNNGI